MLWKKCIHNSNEPSLLAVAVTHRESFLSNSVLTPSQHDLGMLMSLFVTLLKKLPQSHSHWWPQCCAFFTWNFPLTFPIGVKSSPVKKVLSFLLSSLILWVIITLLSYLEKGMNFHSIFLERSLSPSLPYLSSAPQNERNLVIISSMALGICSVRMLCLVSLALSPFL